MYPYEYMNSFKKFFEDNLPDNFDFFSSLKDGCISKKTIDMVLIFGMGLKWKQWLNIMTFI